MSKKKAIKKAKINKKQLYAAVTGRAIELLKKRGGWTKNVYARSKDGEDTFVAKPEACSFCMDGALQRAYVDLTGKKNVCAMSLPFNDMLGRIAKLAGFSGRYDMTLFNDRQRSKKAVIERLQIALLQLENEAA